MSIGVRATSTGPNPQATTIAISLPTGTTTGDVTIACIQSATTTANPFQDPVATASGWTLIASIYGLSVLYRVYQGGDPASVTFTVPYSNWLAACMCSYTGVDTSAPIDGSNYGVIGGSSTGIPFGAAFVTAFQNGLACAVFGNSASSGGVTCSTPTGYTSRVVGNPGPDAYLFEKATTSGGAIADCFATWSNNTTVRGAITFGLKASGAAAATATTIPTLAGIYELPGLVPPPDTNFVATDFQRLKPQIGDLVLIACIGGLNPSLPIGFTSLLSGTGYVIGGRTFRSGDATAISFGYIGGAQGTGSWPVIQVALLRAKGAGTYYPTLGANSAIGSSSTNPSTGITAPSIVPAAATDLLLLLYYEANASGETSFTAPSGTTLMAQQKLGVSDLWCYLNPCPNPSSTRTATGALTSTASGSFGFSLDVTLGVGLIGTGTDNLGPSWGTWSFTDGVTGVAYSDSWDMPLTASPTTYSVVSGSLPTGLSLTNITGNQGQIAGTASAAGTSSFTLRATNSYGTADQAFTITITTASGGGGSYCFAA